MWHGSRSGGATVWVSWWRGRRRGSCSGGAATWRGSRGGGPIAWVSRWRGRQRGSHGGRANGVGLVVKLGGGTDGGCVDFDLINKMRK